jgi:hypothetical protein
MKVSQLIEQLKFLDPEAKVHFEYNYGDRWRTQVAPEVTQVQEGIVEFSQYHGMDKRVEDNEDCYDESIDSEYGFRRVVVLG